MKEIGGEQTMVLREKPSFQSIPLTEQFKFENAMERRAAAMEMGNLMNFENGIKLRSVYKKGDEREGRVP